MIEKKCSRGLHDIAREVATSVTAYFEANGNDHWEKIDEGLPVYIRIQEYYFKGDIERLWPKFSNFYVLRFIGGGKEILQRVLKSKRTDSDPHDLFKEILEAVLEKTSKVHLSYCSKATHTINNDFPIYDANLEDVFGYKPICGDREVAIARMREIDQVYGIIKKEGLLGKTIEEFDARYKGIGGDRISLTKKIDFLIWATGAQKTMVNKQGE